MRFSRNHIYNNLYDSSVSNYCIRAGKEARVLIEGNYFDGVDTPHEFNGNDDATAYISVGSGPLSNSYVGTSGGQLTGGEGTEWDDPPYGATVEPAASVPAAVMAGAGPH